jgi:hypothetical protein
METQKFEEKLLKMTKPEVKDLHHQELLAEAILKAKEKSIVSWWWLSIPLFIIGMLLMKSHFKPGSSLINNIKEYSATDKYSAIFFFVIIPTIFIFVNLLSIRNVFIFLGKPKEYSFLESVWFNLVIILFSIIVLTLYLI